MLVDDAVVVIENCYRYLQQGLSPKESVLKGAAEVAAPVLASVFTTIAAFLPLMLLPGIIGRFMKIVPIVVSLALLASLFECFFIIPSHLAEWSGEKPKRQQRGERFFESVKRIYRKLLEKVLRRRKLVALLMPLAIIAAIGLVPLLGVEMYRDEEIPQFFVRVKLPQGASLDETDKVIQRIENAAMSLPKTEIRDVVATPGFYQSEEEWLFTSNVGQVIVDLKLRRERNLPIDSGYVNYIV
jgi:multidrug efflux pump subunit AcrB